MKPRKLYLDTSVIGGYFDAEFMKPTRRLWELAEAGEYEFLSSEVTKGEMVDAPENVRALFESTFADLLMITDDARTLAMAYLEHDVVTEKSSLPSIGHRRKWDLNILPFLWSLTQGKLTILTDLEIAFPNLGKSASSKACFPSWRLTSWPLCRSSTVRRKSMSPT